MALGNQTNGRELSFPKAYMTLDDWDVRTPTNLYALSGIAYAEVVTRRYPTDWRTFLQVHTVVFLLFATIWAIATSFGWINLAGPLLAVWWLFRTIFDARDAVKKSYKHTLTLETNSGTVEVATSDDEDAILEACEAINKKIK